MEPGTAKSKSQKLKSRSWRLGRAWEGLEGLGAKEGKDDH
jgi:hypothetical protein